MEKITEMIDALVAEKTFSLEGVKAIEAVRAKAESLQKTLEMTTTERDNIRKERDIERNRAEQNAATVKQWEARETAIAAREKTMNDCEKKAAVSDATAGTFRECFSMVFRNFSVNESITKSVPVPQGPGMYPATMTETSHSTVTKT